MKILKKALSVMACGFILLAALVVYAADDDLLRFFPALVKAQTNPVGTWGGGGQGSWGTCTCTLGGITFTVSSGARTGTYFVSVQTTGSATCDSSCGMVLNFQNMPATLVGDRLVFRYSFNSTMGSDTQLMTDVMGELVVSGSSAKYALSTSNFVSPYTQTNGAMTSIVGGTLTKQ